MKSFYITIQTKFGSLTIDDIMANSEEQAFELACELAANEILNSASLAESYEYPNDSIVLNGGNSVDSLGSSNYTAVNPNDNLVTIETSEKIKAIKKTKKAQIFDYLQKQFGDTAFRYTDIVIAALITNGWIKDPSEYDRSIHRGYYGVNITGYGGYYMYLQSKGDTRRLAKTDAGYIIKK
jgi:hypothetical protein